MKVQVCIGSSCHLRGSQEVIKIFTKLIEECPRKVQIELCGSFCIGVCSKGVSVRIEENIYHVTPEDAEDFYHEVILKEAEKCE